MIACRVMIPREGNKACESQGIFAIRSILQWMFTNLIAMLLFNDVDLVVPKVEVLLCGMRTGNMRCLT